MKYVKKVWNIEPQKMLDEILRLDAQNDLCPTLHIGEDLETIREIYECINGLDSLTEAEQIENGYYRLEIA